MQSAATFAGPLAGLSGIAAVIIPQTQHVLDVGAHRNEMLAYPPCIWFWPSIKSPIASAKQWFFCMFLMRNVSTQIPWFSSSSVGTIYAGNRSWR
jgi:hypothetical protein